eukprot:707919-Amphidinium_carterae.1
MMCHIFLEAEKSPNSIPLTKHMQVPERDRSIELATAAVLQTLDASVVFDAACELPRDMGTNLARMVWLSFINDERERILGTSKR